MRVSFLRRTGLRAVAFLCLALFLTSGCVSMTQYHDLEKQRDTVADRNRRLQMELDALKNRNEELSAQMEKLAAEREEAARLLEEQESNREELIRRLQREIDEKSVRISMMEDQLRVELLDRLLFASGSAELTPEGKEILGRIAPTLKEAGDQQIRVIGHTDAVPVGPSLKARYPSNWELSAARAAAVVRVLQWGFGIPPERMSVEGVAQYRPLKVGGDEKVRKENRAVEIVLAPAPR